MCLSPIGSHHKVQVYKEPAATGRPGTTAMCHKPRKRMSPTESFNVSLLRPGELLSHKQKFITANMTGKIGII